MAWTASAMNGTMLYHIWGGGGREMAEEATRQVLAEDSAVRESQRDLVDARHLARVELVFDAVEDEVHACQQGSAGVSRIGALQSSYTLFTSSLM